ncbi:hypothetical protein [Cryobacterium sp. SO1]|uniref:hypothetical protein n=1 Tax=Cryobacterium sp. SO1 TaxID=1897061 RepID=UPI001023D8B1|nr:hypothetical protein [Cryobacterium sp. SO1]RZI36905.1 hypothetical protein BJQ95_00689 [Cryobacterium sp. SO1]
MTGVTLSHNSQRTVVEHYASPHRYGVFLRPSPELIRDCITAFGIASGQFGFTAAAAFPPHATLVGSIALAPNATETDLRAAIKDALAEVAPFTVHNAGLGRQFVDSIGYDIDGDGTGTGTGTVNRDLRAVMEKLFHALSSLTVFPSSDRFIESRKAASSETTRGHVTVVGHDGAGHPELLDELLEVLEELDLDHPSTFLADTITLYRLTSEDWTGKYWQSMRWEVLESVRLSA